MSDVSLTIGTDSSQAARDLDKLVAKQNEMEKATKKLDATSVAGYHEQAKAMLQMERMQKQAWAASQKAVIENQKAQSRAKQEAFKESKRLAEEQKKSNEKAASDEARAVIDIRKRAMREAVGMAREESREERAVARETHREMQSAWRRTMTARKEWQREGKKEMDEAAAHYEKSHQGMMGGWARVGTAALSAVAGMMSAQAVIGVLRDIQSRFDGITKSADETAKAMRPLATQVAGKGGAEEVKKIARMGAEYGLTPQETGEIGNTLKSIQGADVAKDLPTIAKLANLGVQGQDAAPIAQAGIVRGMGSARASDLALKAADLASWDVSDVARVMPKTMLFSSMESGLAAGSVLAEAGVVKEQIPAQTEALSRVLGKDKSKLSKKFGLAGLSEAERVNKLSAAADASGNRAEFLRTMPEKYDLGEEEGRALRATLSLGNRYGEYEQQLRATPKGELDTRFAQVMQDPMQKREFEARRSDALTRYATDFGPMAEKAEQERASKQATGARLMREMPSEAAAAMTDDQGRANWLGRGWSALQNIGGGSGVAGALRAVAPGGGGAFGQAAGQEFLPSVFGGGSGDKRAEANTEVSKLVEALDKNTEATKANTTNTPGEAASTSAPATRDRNAGL